MPRDRLTALRVVEEAELVADDCGLENLTLTAVAPRLGVQMPSLYKHIAGMDGLLRAMSTRAKNEMADVLARAAAGKAGAEAATALAHAWRTWASEHPGRYAAAVRHPDDTDAEDRDASIALRNIVIAALASFGLEGDEVIHAVRVLRSNLHGFISTELAGGFGMPIDVDRSFELLVASVVRTLSEWPPKTPARTHFPQALKERR